MKFIVHRGAREVGGSCVEFSYRDSSILVDVGLPLDFDFSDDPELHLLNPFLTNWREGRNMLMLSSLAD